MTLDSTYITPPPRRIPDIDTFRRRVLEFEEADKSNWTEEEFHTNYFSAYGFFPRVTQGYNPDSFNERIFYRATNIDERVDNINDPSRFSYPPPEYCKQNGRANIKGKSVFYAADEIRTAVCEARIEEGNTVYVSSWKPKFLNTVKIVNLLPQDTPVENPYHDMAVDCYQGLKTHVKAWGIEDAYFDELFNSVADIFKKDKAPYHISSWFANRIMNSRDGVNGVLYPSVAMSLKTNNFAFSTDTIDNFFTLYKLEKYKLTSQKDSHLELIDTGTVADNKIYWT